MKVVTRQEIIERPQASLGAHAVLLGAGASRAAFPQGDPSSRRIPLMDDLVETLNLRPIIERAGRFENENFELIYSRIAAEAQHDEARREIEQKVGDYFSSLYLPHEATIYDRILLSLRPRDAVFTFNWDPFLFDAYVRNSGEIGLPGIFFLHGNVRIGRCPRHRERWGQRHATCPTCGETFKNVPLFYPVENKNYSNDPYVSDSWDSARSYFREALVLTIFGYSAPSSDAAAVELLRSAWMERSERRMEHVEIIDIAPEESLHERWKEFTPTHHFHARRDFDDSWMARWPRRSREAVFIPMSLGIPCPDFPLSGTKDLVELHAQVREIAKWETR